MWQLPYGNLLKYLSLSAVASKKKWENKFLKITDVFFYQKLYLIVININNSDVCLFLHFIRWLRLNFFILKIRKKMEKKNWLSLNENFITTFFLKQQNIILLRKSTSSKKKILMRDLILPVFRTYYLQQLFQQLWRRKKVSTNKLILGHQFLGKVGMKIFSI